MSSDARTNLSQTPPKDHDTEIASPIATGEIRAEPDSAQSLPHRRGGVGVLLSVIGGSRARLDMVGVLRRFGLLAVFLALIAYLGSSNVSFRSKDNLLNILQQNSIYGIVACGMLIMIISGGFDLSVGATGATTAVVAAKLSAHSGTFVTVVVALLCGLVIGTANGFLIAKVKINPFIATLGMASVVTGALFVATNAQPVYGDAKRFFPIGLGRTFGIPTAFVLFLGCAALTWLLLSFSRFGHYIYSVGGNDEASRLSGVPVAAVRIGVYAYGGVMASVAGLVLLGQTSIGQPNSATDWPLTAIAICVVGGAALSGGSGRVSDTVIAVLLLGTVANGLNQSNVSPYWQPLVTGVVIIVAVALDSYNRRRQRT